MRLQLNDFTQKLYFDVLWFRKKKSEQDLESKKKIEKKLIVAKSGLVGMKGNLKTYNNPVKYFLRHLSRFSIKQLFTPNFRGGFWVLKPKPRDSLPRNLTQTFNLVISNCC